MSWEGYEQLICANGHYRARGDGYGPLPSRPPECDCGAPFTHSNLVNCTNGCHGNPCRCGMRTIIQVTPPKTCICSTCGNEHEVTEATYRFGEVHTYDFNG